MEKAKSLNRKISAPHYKTLFKDDVPYQVPYFDVKDNSGTRYIRKHFIQFLCKANLIRTFKMTDVENLYYLNFGDLKITEEAIKAKFPSLVFATEWLKDRLVTTSYPVYNSNKYLEILSLMHSGTKLPTENCVRELYHTYQGNLKFVADYYDKTTLSA